MASILQNANSTASFKFSKVNAHFSHGRINLSALPTETPYVTANSDVSGGLKPKTLTPVNIFSFLERIDFEL